MRLNDNLSAGIMDRLLEERLKSLKPGFQLNSFSTGR
jgi:hypothetical protein